jgi:hypothetical protein
MSIDQERLGLLAARVRETDTEFEHLLTTYEKDARPRHLHSEIGEAWEAHMRSRDALLRYVMENV